MKHFLAVLLFAITAGLVSCQVASNEGIKGIPAHLKGLLDGAANRMTAGAKIEAAVVGSAELKEKVAEVQAKTAEVVAAAKAKVADVAEKAVEAAAPADATDAPAAEAAAPAATTSPAGITHFYGSSAGTAVAAWSAEAAMNPDYVVAADAAAAEPAEPEASPGDAEGGPITEDATAAPVSLGGTGVTSYFGLAAKPDAEQLWAAAAAMNADYQTAEAAPASSPEPAASEPAAEVAAPVSLGGVGVTSFMGVSEKADATQAWAAPATMNPDYSAEAPAPVAVEAAPVVAAEEPAPVSLGGVGVTSFMGVSEKADATQPWAAAATMNPGYSAAAPATAQAADGCADALNAAAKVGQINFGMARWDITQDSYRTLDKIAALAKDCGTVMIEVAGHTDSTGKSASNRTLSELRADAVVKYLTKAGVSSDKLKSVGYGQDKPIGDNGTSDGRRQNRRIEFLVTAK